MAGVPTVLVPVMAMVGMIGVRLDRLGRCGSARRRVALMVMGLHGWRILGIGGARKSLLSADQDPQQVTD